MSEAKAHDLVLINRFEKLKRTQSSRIVALAVACVTLFSTRTWYHLKIDNLHVPDRSSIDRHCAYVLAMIGRLVWPLISALETLSLTDNSLPRHHVRNDIHSNLQSDWISLCRRQDFASANQGNGLHFETGSESTLCCLDFRPRRRPDPLISSQRATGEVLCLSRPGPLF